MKLLLASRPSRHSRHSLRGSFSGVPKALRIAHATSATLAATWASLTRAAAFAAFAMLGSVPLAAHADTATDTLKTTLQKQLGNRAKVSEVRRTPIPGLYEVTVDKQIIYSDSTARYIVVGDMRDTATGKNLTQARVDEVNRIDFATLPLKDAIKVVRGNGKRKMAVFSDPNCPYCHKLEQSLQNVDNVTIYTFLDPILSADSAVKAKQIWCSKDPGKAWEDWMILRSPPSAGTDCNVGAIQRNLSLAQQLNISGTPAIFFADGSRVPGYISAEDIEAKLKEAN